MLLVAAVVVGPADRRHHPAARTAGEDRLLVGPYMAAAINDLPQAPAPPRRI
jgi:hypothetical protein